MAALLGGDVADAVRQASGCALTASGLNTAPIIAAQLCLQQAFDDDLPLSFFTNWLGLKNFSDEDVATFSKVVAEFSKRVESARKSEPAQLQPAGADAPWLQPAAAASMASPCAPADLVRLLPCQFACAATGVRSGRASPAEIAISAVLRWLGQPPRLRRVKVRSGAASPSLSQSPAFPTATPGPRRPGPSAVWLSVAEPRAAPPPTPRAPPPPRPSSSRARSSTCSTTTPRPQKS